MREGLCFDVLRRIGGRPVFSSSVSSRFRAPEMLWSPGPFSGRHAAEVGGSRLLPNVLLYGTEEQFSVWSRDTSDRVFGEVLRIPGFDTSDGRKQRLGFAEMLAQFSAARTDRPVLAWLTPVWLLRRAGLPLGAVMADRAAPPETLGRSRLVRRGIDLCFGHDGDQITVPPDLLESLSYPRERGREPSLVRMSRTTRAHLGGLSLFNNVTEQALILASPRSDDDARWLRQGKSPAQSHIWTDEAGPPRLDCPTITVARAQAMPNGRQAVMEQFTLALTRCGGVMDIRASKRRFHLFVEHHLGIQQALESVVRT